MRSGSSASGGRPGSKNTMCRTCRPMPPSRRSLPRSRPGGQVVCEQAHQQLKEELGLDHFEGRSWTGLHRHALMTMIAYAFLQSRRLKAAGRKKRILRTAATTKHAGHQASYPRPLRTTSTPTMSSLDMLLAVIAKPKVPKYASSRADRDSIRSGHRPQRRPQPRRHPQRHPPPLHDVPAQLERRQRQDDQRRRFFGTRRRRSIRLRHKQQR